MNHYGHISYYYLPLIISNINTVKLIHYQFINTNIKE